MEPSNKEDIRQTIESMLSKMEVPYIITPSDQHLYDLCCKIAIEKGYPIGTNPSEPSIRPWLGPGVALASIGYGHLESEATRVFITLYTAFFLYIDDVYEHDNSGISTFVSRFVRGEKQAEPVLDALARFLLEIPDNYDPFVANIIMACALNHVNASTLEYQTQKMKVSIHAKEFPNYARRLSGGSETYALLVFPNIPVDSYIQCLPEICNFLGYANDVLSFYKEEEAGENVNYISLLAESQGQPKMKAFTGLANEVARLDLQVGKILKGEPDAYETWQRFKAGFVAFHTSFNERYHLDKLMTL